jgi:hypothetical protein
MRSRFAAREGEAPPVAFVLASASAAGTRAANAPAARAEACKKRRREDIGEASGDGKAVEPGHPTELPREINA